MTEPNPRPSIARQAGLPRVLGWIAVALSVVAVTSFLEIRQADPGTRDLIALARETALVILIGFLAVRSNLRTPAQTARRQETDTQPRILDHQRLFDSLEHGVVYQNPEGEIIAANNSACRILGLTLDQLRGRTSIDPRWKSIHADGSPFPGEEHPAMVALRTGNPVRGALMGVHVPGLALSRWLLIDAIPEFLPGQPKPYRAFAVFTDVSELMRAEDALRGKEAQLNRIFATTPGVICAFRKAPDGRYSFPYASPRIQEIYDIPPELLARDASPIFSRIHPDDTHNVQDAIEASAATLTPWRQEFRVLSPHRGLLWIEGYSQPQRDDDGSVVWHGYIHDITARKKAEAALRTSEDKFARTFRASPDMLVISTLDEGIIIEANPAATRTTGFSHEELVGKRVIELGLWCDPNRRATYVAQLRSQGTLNNFEANLRAKNGRILEALISGELLQLDGTPHVLSVIRDVTEWKRIQTDLIATARTSHDIVQSIPAGLFIYRYIEPDRLELLSANPAAERLTGLRLTDWQGREFNEIWPKARDAGITDRYLQVVRTGVPFDSDVLDYSDRKMRGSFWMRVFPLPEKRLAVAFENTTARRQAERALRDSETLLRTLFDAVPESIFLLDRDGVILAANTTFANRIGQTPAECLGQVVYDLLPQPLAEERRRRVQQVLDSGQPILFEDRDGDRWLLNNVRPILGAHGTVERLVFFAVDTTERHRNADILEARLRLIDFAAQHSLQELLRATLDEAERLTQSTIGFYHFLESDQVTLRLQAWSTNTTQSMCTAEGAGRHYSVTEAGVWADAVRERRSIIHNDYASLPNRRGLPPGHAAILRQIVIPVLRGTHITAILGVGNKATDYVDDDLRAVSTLADVAWDIAERKRAEEALRQSEARFRDITFTMADWVWEVDPQGRYTFASESVRKVLGCEASEILGRTPFDLMPPEEAERIRAIFTDHAQRKAPFSDVENINLHRDGSLRHLLTSGVPILAPDGSLVGYRGCDRDVTDRKRLEQQYLRAQRLESIGALASGIAHDLNNVLAPILMSVEVLKDSLSGLEDRAMLDMLKTSAHRGAGIVRQLLVFARGSESHRSRLKSGYLIREISKIAAETFPRSIRFRTQVSEGLMDLDGDSTQIHQVLLNLCVNARDAMPHGGELRLSAENVLIDEMYARMNPDATAGTFVRLTVADSGVGIPPNVIEHIFEPFFTTKPQGQGTGLGLATVQSIVRTHGGFLEVSSQVGHGSEFRVYLPALPPENNDSESSDTLTLPSGNGETILVVDDEDPIRNAATSILAKHGYHPLAAVDGAEALAIFAQNQSTIRGAVVDMMMPLMDGPTTITALRRIAPDLPIVAMSGLPEQERAARSVAETHLHFLQKPFTAELLLQTIHALIQETHPASPPPPASS